MTHKVIDFQKTDDKGFWIFSQKQIMVVGFEFLLTLTYDSFSPITFGIMFWIPYCFLIGLSLYLCAVLGKGEESIDIKIHNWLIPKFIVGIYKNNFFLAKNTKTRR